MKLLNIAKNEYIYSLITKFITMAISLVQSVLVARYLGAAIQGTSSYITSIVSIGAIVVTFGMHQAYPYFRKKYGKESFFSDFISIIVIVFSLYFLLAFFIALFMVSKIELRAAVLLTPLYGYDRVVSYICTIEEPNKRNTYFTIVSIIDVFFICILMIFTKRSLLTAIIILVFAELLKSVVFSWVLHVNKFFTIKRSLLPFGVELLKMGFFPMVALLMTTLNYKIDILMLRASPIITSTQIGVYAIGMSFADKIVLIPDTLKGILVSKLSKGADEREVAKVSRMCFWATLLVCMAFLILGESLINILYGDEYSGAYSVLIICSFGSIFVGYFKLIAQYNIVNRKQIRNVALLSISILVNIILNLLLIPKYQLKGAALASGIGYFLSGWVFILWFAMKNNIKLAEMILLQKSDVKAITKMIRE